MRIYIGIKGKVSHFADKFNIIFWIISSMVVKHGENSMIPRSIASSWKWRSKNSHRPDKPWTSKSNQNNIDLFL
jgi:hypothetical protein